MSVEKRSEHAVEICGNPRSHDADQPAKQRRMRIFPQTKCGQARMKTRTPMRLSPQEHTNTCGSSRRHYMRLYSQGKGDTCKRSHKGHSVMQTRCGYKPAKKQRRLRTLPQIRAAKRAHIDRDATLRLWPARQQRRMRTPRRNKDACGRPQENDD